MFPPGVAPGLPARRAKPGDILILYGLGFGPVTPNLIAGTLVEQSNTLSSFHAAFGGVQATVQFAGLVQSYTGLYQYHLIHARQQACRQREVKPNHFGGPVIIG